MERLIVINDNCCGCGACKSICPTSAINMTRDLQGFVYPNIDEDKCVNCGRCSSICALNLGLSDSRCVIPSEYYAVCLSDLKRLGLSQSGGAFEAIANVILAKNGVVYGAALSSDYLYASHIRVENLETLDKVKLSKYIESDISNIFDLIEEDLNNGKTVLFSGTPCQCYQVTNRFNLYQDNLLTCEVLCHGVPSPEVWRTYISYLTKKYRSVPEEVVFRDKKAGWKTHVERIVIKGKNRANGLFTRFFHENIGLRQSCYNCKFTTIGRYADFTIGDFWGIETVLPEFYEEHKNGISVMSFNTEKSKIIKNDILNLTVYDIIKQYPIKFQPHLRHPVIVPEARKAFLLSIDKNGVEYTFIRYMKRARLKRLTEKIIYKMKHIVKR